MSTENGHPADLIAGEVYFVVTFDDDSLRFPLIQTARFLKRELCENGEKYVYLFQDLACRDRSVFFIDTDDLDGLLFDKEGLIQLLKK